jgi:hypothetical protein
VRDFEGVRHWLRVGGELRRLHDLPRRYSERPGVQFFNVLGAPPVAEIPFAHAFDASPDFTAEGWLAIQARDGARLVAVATKRSLCLFQNSELSCVHCVPDFGALGPGDSAETLTRIYVVESSLEDWYLRMRGELFG